MIKEGRGAQRRGAQAPRVGRHAQLNAESLAYQIEKSLEKENREKLDAGHPRRRPSKGGSWSCAPCSSRVTPRRSRRRRMHCRRPGPQAAQGCSTRRPPRRSPANGADGSGSRLRRRGRRGRRSTRSSPVTEDRNVEHDVEQEEPVRGIRAGPRSTLDEARGGARATATSISMRSSAYEPQFDSYHKQVALADQQELAAAPSPDSSSRRTFT